MNTFLKIHFQRMQYRSFAPYFQCLHTLRTFIPVRVKKSVYDKMKRKACMPSNDNYYVLVLNASGGGKKRYEDEHDRDLPHRSCGLWQAIVKCCGKATYLVVILLASLNCIILLHFVTPVMRNNHTVKPKKCFVVFTKAKRRRDLIKLDAVLWTVNMYSQHASV